MTEYRIETNSLGQVEVPAGKLWGAQSQRSLEHFSIGLDLMPPEMITAYATLKKAAANANHVGGRLTTKVRGLIVQACDEILDGWHHDMFPLHVWMTGSGTQFNMNINEVISNRCCQLAGTPLGSKQPVHPNDHVNASQSSNDTFSSAMNIAAASAVKTRLMPAVAVLRDAIAVKAEEWDDKIGRTHMQDATPPTLGQEWPGYAVMLSDNLERLDDALKGVYQLARRGTAVGAGVHANPGFAEAAAAEIARLTGLSFVSAPNKFAVQGAHDALVQLSGALRTLAVSLFKIANDIRPLSCGPRAGFAELLPPENEPGSSIMPGKVNPTQAEALTMIAVQVMANDVAIGFGGAGGYLEMNVYKPLMIANIAQSITILAEGCTNFRKYLVEGPGEPQDDRRICRAFADAGDRARPGDRLRQGVKDRPPRARARPDARSGTRFADRHARRSPSSQSVWREDGDCALFEAPVSLVESDDGVAHSSGRSVMARPMSLQALTANLLADGDVAFWSHGRWMARFEEAELFEDRDAAASALDLARGQPTVVVEPNLVDVERVDGLATPASYRERVRALGPGVRPELGKQAEGGPVVAAMLAAHGTSRSKGRLGLIRRK